MSGPLDGEERLSAAVARLVARGELTQAQAVAVQQEFARPDGARGPGEGQPGPITWTTLLAEVGGYIGAAFVVAAAAALISPAWGDFGIAARVSTLVGPGLLLLLAGLMVGRGARGQHGPRHRLVSVLLLAMAGLFTGAAGVLADPALPHRHLPPDVVAGVALVACLAAYAWQRGFLLQLGLTGSAWWAAVAWSKGIVDDDVSVSAGSATVVLGITWFVLAVTGVLAEHAIALVSGGVVVFTGAELLIGTRWGALGYLVLLGLVAVGLAVYATRHELAALAVGGVTLAVLVPQFVIDKTDGALGASGALLISGLSIVAASVIALRMRNATDA